MSYTALPTKNPGDLLTSALWNTYLQGNANSGFMRMVADTTLSIAGANVVFSSIAATFAHLIGLVYARDTSAGTGNASILAQMNGDTAANYDFQQQQANGTAVSTTQSFGQTGAAVGHTVGGGAPAGLFSACMFIIPHYTNAISNKSLIALYGEKWGIATGNLNIAIASAFWRSNAAINQITFVPGAGSFAAGSRFTLYGLPQ